MYFGPLIHPIQLLPIDLIAFDERSLLPVHTFIKHYNSWDNLSVVLFVMQ